MKGADRIQRPRGPSAGTRVPKATGHLILAHTICGSVLLFAAFVAQNYYKAVWSEEKARLARSQLAIDVAEVRMEHWLAILLAEQRKPSPDPEILKAVTFKFIVAFSNLEAWAAVRTMEDAMASEMVLSSKNKYHEQARNLWKASDLDGLTRLANKLIAVARNVEQSVDLNARFLKLYDQVRRDEAFWDKVYLLAYVIGSLLLGVAYLLHRTRAGGGAEA